MMVRAGKIPVRIPLVQNPTFEIRYNNLSLAQPGDPVTISGFYNPPDETKVLADSFAITTDRVYGEPVVEDSKKKVAKRRSRRRSAKNAGTDADASNEDSEEAKVDSESEDKAESPDES